MVFLQKTGILYPKVDVAVNRQHEDQADEDVRVSIRILPSRIVLTPFEPPFEPPLEQLPVGHPETFGPCCTGGLGEFQDDPLEAVQAGVQTVARTV